MSKAFSGVGARLALALLVVLAGAWTLVYLIVVPSLENRLVDARVSAARPRGAGHRPRAAGRPVPVAGLRRSRVRERKRAGGRLRHGRAADRTRGRRRLAGFPLERRPARPDRAAGGRASHRPDRHDHARRRAVCRGRGAGARIIVRRAGLLVAARGRGDRSGRPRAAPAGRRARSRGRAGGRVCGGVAVRAASAAAGSRCGARSRRGGSTSRSPIPERTRSASSRGRSTGCVFGSPQLDHARREFIANASHELRTPVFSLGGFLELLSDEELDEATRREFFATMSEQVDRLAKLATELLDLSRADAGRLQVRARAGRPRGGRRDGRGRVHGALARPAAVRWNSTLPRARVGHG